jgi:hypothetical protein
MLPGPSRRQHPFHAPVRRIAMTKTGEAIAEGYKAIDNLQPNG